MSEFDIVKTFLNDRMVTEGKERNEENSSLMFSLLVDGFRDERMLNVQQQACGTTTVLSLIHI